ncbi:hypothetical protein DFH11DRAFT_1833847 [Phellopilus nigrolimitatus]|nr:hypothetical protein DFH11DRAFT_1833847 [Phellopilus nigrolimitatus]
MNPYSCTRNIALVSVEVPPVVTAAAEPLLKTKEAVTLLTALGAYADVQKVYSHKHRAGKGKLRNCRHCHRRGPLIAYSETTASSEIQAVVCPAGPKINKCPWTQHKNPLTNKLVLFRLNPYAKTLTRDGGWTGEMQGNAQQAAG